MKWSASDRIAAVLAVAFVLGLLWLGFLVAGCSTDPQPTQSYLGPPPMLPTSEPWKFVPAEYDSHGVISGPNLDPEVAPKAWLWSTGRFDLVALEVECWCPPPPPPGTIGPPWVPDYRFKARAVLSGQWNGAALFEGDTLWVDRFYSTSPEVIYALGEIVAVDSTLTGSVTFGVAGACGPSQVVKTYFTLVPAP